MSTTTYRLPLAVAAPLASSFCGLIADDCDELLIAGSIRRRAATVGDIEIVCVPSVLTVVPKDLFGDPVPGAATVVNRLTQRLDGLVADGVIARRPRRDGRLAWGPHAKAISFEGVSIDLYSPEAERYGWVVLVRTGPKEFARQLVIQRPTEHEPTVRTSDGRLGLMPPTVRAAGGWLTDRTSGRLLETPTEQEAFAVLGLPYIEPWNRS